MRRILFGRPRSLYESKIFHRLSLIPVLAWIGLGADGLSSSSYGPEELFRALGEHTYMALGLALLTAITVCLISLAYSHIIEEFPTGGGGYLVASKTLGSKLGAVSGCALLVDYILTIAVSITAAGDAMFSFLPLSWHFAKLPLMAIVIIGLTVLNIRGVKESVLTLAPIFFLFIVTHAILIGVGVFTHVESFPVVGESAVTGLSSDYALLGLGTMLSIFVYAYSLGGGTYTGIEAVSNAMQIMRAPQVQTAKRTMLYMAVSLSVAAAGLIVCYLLWDVIPQEGKTMNAVLAEQIAYGWPLGRLFVILTMLAAAGILVVATQAGFLGGPRILANMAVDSWVPHRFAMLSERLTTMNGIVLMGVAALALLLYTRGNIHSLVVMYSINVFLTFSLSMLGMWRLWWQRQGREYRKRRLTLYTAGLLLCGTILVITIIEKFTEGGWITIFLTGGVVVFCFLIRAHYLAVSANLTRLDATLTALPVKEPDQPMEELKPGENTAAVLVGGYSGLGVHTLLAVIRSFPKHYRNVVFISVGVLDSGEMKGAEEVHILRKRTEESLEKYVRLAHSMNLPATSRMAVGTDVVEESLTLCLGLAKEFRHITFFAGKLVFQREYWYQALLHNQMALSLQKRLWWEGQTMVVLPVRVM
ncbi:MAG TPA: APC family permease [Candidatus Deferrimicrobium sp.]|nr:APC family permease [Candidatus Deferrimicrobium sp.]